MRWRRDLGRMALLQVTMVRHPVPCMSTQLSFDDETAMRTRRRVIAGFDGSTAAVAAIEWAAQEATAYGASLRMVSCSTVPAPVDFYGIGARQLRSLDDAVSAIRQRHPQLVVEPVATHLDPRDALVEEATTADLLVLGASESTALKTLLVDSVPRTAARRSSCPLVVVRGRQAHPLRRVVVGVDGSNPADAAIDWACRRANRDQAELVVVHAWHQPASIRNRSSRDATRTDAGAILDQAVDRCHALGAVAVHRELVEGTPATILVEASRRADLLVVGSRGRSRLTTTFLGSVATAVSGQAQCPVVILPPRTHPTMQIATGSR